MTELRLGDQRVRFDRGATIAAYSVLSDGWADRCTCSCCRNFILARGQAFPNEFRTLLSQLGIDLSKEGEAVHYGSVEGNLHFYGGWFYLVGELIEVGERLATISLPGSQFLVQQLPGQGGFQYWFASRFARPPAIFGSRVAALEFSTLLPWVLENPYNSGTNP